MMTRWTNESANSSSRSAAASFASLLRSPFASALPLSPFDLLSAPPCASVRRAPAASAPAAAAHESPVGGVDSSVRRARMIHSSASPFGESGERSSLARWGCHCGSTMATHVRRRFQRRESRSRDCHARARSERCIASALLISSFVGSGPTDLVVVLVVVAVGHARQRRAAAAVEHHRDLSPSTKHAVRASTRPHTMSREAKRAIDPSCWCRASTSSAPRRELLNQIS